MKKANRMFIMTAVVLIGLALWLPGFRSRVTAQSPTLAGSYGFSITAGSLGAIQGVITLDGAGNVTGGSGITASVSSDPNATVPEGLPADGLLLQEAGRRTFAASSVIAL